MLVDADMEIVMSLCEVCPSQDTTGVAEILLICFESRDKVMPLLKAVIQKEISLTGMFFIHSRRSLPKN
jgi:neurofibromin 1